MTVTVDTILAWIKESVENRHPIDPATWVEISLKLNALKEGETSKLYLIRQKLAVQRAALIAQGKTAAASKVEIEATDDYRLSKEQESKIDRIEETVRLAKLQARLAQEQIKGN